MDIYLAKTQGFCSGVTCAVEIMEQALAKYGLPLYVLHEIVHNSWVVNDFKNRGVVFVEDILAVPFASRIVFSAHGVPPSIYEIAAKHKLTVIDATCPLVKKIHREAERYSRKGYTTILIGHKGHQEMIGTSGYLRDVPFYFVSKPEDVFKLNINTKTPIAYLTQTTLLVDEVMRVVATMKAHFGNIIEPSRLDICYATQNRQNAVKELTEFCDFIIICGSPNSSNSNRLYETAQKAGVVSCIIDRVQELNFHQLEKYKYIGISSGASVPRYIVEELVDQLLSHFPDAKVHRLKDPEKNFVFPNPQI